MFDLIAAWFAAGLFAAGSWIVADSFAEAWRRHGIDRAASATDVTRARRGLPPTPA